MKLLTNSVFNAKFISLSALLAVTICPAAFCAPVKESVKWFSRADADPSLQVMLDADKFCDVRNAVKKCKQLSQLEKKYWLAKAWLREDQFDHERREEALLKENGVLFSSRDTNSTESEMTPKVTKALKCINEAIKEKTDDARFYILRSKAYEQSYMSSAAILDASKAIALDSGRAEAWEQRASVWYNHGQGMKEFEFAECADPVLKGRMLDISKMEDNTAQFVATKKEALADINKAIELDPKNAEFYSFRGRILNALGEPTEKELADETRAVFLDPKNPNYYYRRAFTWQFLNPPRFDKALEDANKAVELAPGVTEYRNLRALFLSSASSKK